MIKSLNGKPIKIQSITGTVATCIHLDHNHKPIQLGFTVFGLPRYKKSIVNVGKLV